MNNGQSCKLFVIILWESLIGVYWILCVDLPEMADLLYTEYGSHLGTEWGNMLNSWRQTLSSCE